MKVVRQLTLTLKEGFDERNLPTASYTISDDTFALLDQNAFSSWCEEDTPQTMSEVARAAVLRRLATLFGLKIAIRKGLEVEKKG